jgi:hypothetical protein
MGSGRMTIKKFDAILHILSPTSVRTQLIANIDPNISFLPNALLEFGMKHLASVLLSKLQTASKKAALDPVKNPHAIKMREEKEFYQTWLLAKFHAVCEARGWDMPPVASFNLSEQDRHKAQRYMKRGRDGQYDYVRAQTFPTESPSHDEDDEVVTNPSNDETDTYSDAMSALSTNTGRISVLSNNPITSYLRETERKVQQRKADAEAESRRRAFERLQPKDRSYSDEERLNALKLAKYRRIESTPTTVPTRDVNTAASTPANHPSYSQRLASQLYNHSPRARYGIVLTLVCVLLILLHTGVLVQNSKILSTHLGMPWYMNRAKDLGTIAYIFFCATPHYLLVNVSLVYAFDALDIGSKSGRQAKAYYSDHVNAASLLASFGIAIGSVSLALSKAFVRTAIWSFAKVWSFLCRCLFKPSTLLRTNSLQLPYAGVLREWFMTTISTILVLTNLIVSMVTTGARLIWHYFIQSNFVGRGIAGVLTTGYAAGLKSMNQMNLFVEYSIKSFDSEVVITSWRVEAFSTARFLFLNTAVFLLVILTLFYLSSRRPSPTTVKCSKVKEEGSKSSASPLSNSSQSPMPAEPLMQRYAAIPEDEIVEVVDLNSFTAVDNASSEGTGSKRRRFLFRQR